MKTFMQSCPPPQKKKREDIQGSFNKYGEFFFLKTQNKFFLSEFFHECKIFIVWNWFITKFF